MNRFKQHVPNFIDGVTPVDLEFETLEELLAIPCLVKRASWPKFSHFAMSDDLLLVVLDEGFEWWVCGYIKNPSAVGLPKWEGPKHRVTSVEIPK